ncbi:hypothetical protein [Nocardioides sp.]|uniref:hypothetical protein n=1 Tax=Nocardioides sp. TaxID=35761 RepID=UPI003D101C3D
MFAKAFEIHVRGSLPADTWEDFEDLHSTVVGGETVLSGVLADQAALYGVLLRIQSLGLELVEVRRLGRGVTPD